MQGGLFGLLGVHSGADLRSVSKRVDIPIDSLKYYNDNHILPSFAHLKKLSDFLVLSELEIKLALGFIDQTILDGLAAKYNEIATILGANNRHGAIRPLLQQQVFESDFGKLYNGDCVSLLRELEDESVDVVFADPPFNLSKLYPSMMNDNLKHQEYIKWTQEWIWECTRVLKPGGSFFFWNLPKWNTYFSSYLNQLLTFRHWVAVDIKYSLPIAGRLYPSHYSLLYYCKGDRPKSFNPDRLPMAICPHCYADLVDYGGYKDKMNPLGVNLTDVWYDVPPVRHVKYKKRTGANELSVKLLDRIIEMSSDEGDVIFDPFGGSGTTYAVAEIKKRRWLGVELGPCDGIIDRMMGLEEERKYLEQQRSKLNTLMGHECQAQRVKRGIWTPTTIRKRSKEDEGSFEF